MQPWVTIAQRYIGTKEIPGPKSNPTILGWASRLGGWVASWFKNDDTPWCALFVNAILQEAKLPLSGSGAALVRAKSFETYGIKLDIPTLGAILVFNREGGGHVGFYMGETLQHYRVLGGNQNNTVNEVWIEKSRCTAIRWPTGIPVTAERRWLRPDGTATSTNER